MVSAFLTVMLMKPGASNGMDICIARDAKVRMMRRKSLYSNA
jgi:hypothetical protein